MVSERRAIARQLSKTMKCNCDLDAWEPEKSTGHSHVCRIHKAAMQYALLVSENKKCSFCHEYECRCAEYERR